MVRQGGVSGRASKWLGIESIVASPRLVTFAVALVMLVE